MQVRYRLGLHEKEMLEVLELWDVWLVEILVDRRTATLRADGVGIEPGLKICTPVSHRAPRPNPRGAF
jgi:hypothetical protein